MVPAKQGESRRASAMKPCPCGEPTEPFSKYCVACMEADVFAECAVEECCEESERGDIH